MNILVVRNDKLGDFITALPTIYVLKKHNKNNKVFVLVAPLNKELADACEFIDGVIVDRKQNVFGLSREIREYEIDASVTLFSNTRVALAQFLARIPKRIAPATKVAQIFYTHRIKQRRSQAKMAEFEYNLALAKELFQDIQINYPQPLLAFEDAKEFFNKFTIKNGIQREVIIFHVGSGGSSDLNWSLYEYEQMILNVLDANVYDVILTFGPDETVLYDQMKDRLFQKNVYFYLSVDGLVYFAKLVSQVKLFVSTSTGTYHIASLVGTPTMTFFADNIFSSPKRWKSIGPIEKQIHYILPFEAEKRNNLLEEVKEKLIHFKGFV